MYRPPHFRVDDPELMLAVVRDFPLGLLISNGPQGLIADPLPFLWDGKHLRAHLSRANPQVAALRAAEEVLVVFSGPQAYVTPNAYASKAETQRVVPTWNYVVVQAYGVPTLREEPETIRELVSDLTNVHEAADPAPWAVTDAPEDFVAAQVKGIIGLEIEVQRWEGKWKVSQNKSEADRAGVLQRLAGHQMAEWVENPPTRGS